MRVSVLPFVRRHVLCVFYIFSSMLCSAALHPNPESILRLCFNVTPSQLGRTFLTHSFCVHIPHFSLVLLNKVISYRAASVQYSTTDIGEARSGLRRPSRFNVLSFTDMRHSLGTIISGNNTVAECRSNFFESFLFGFPRRIN